MSNVKNIKESKITQVFSFEVVMTVHVIADSEKEAQAQLDEKGGIMTKREKTLLNIVPLYGEIKEANK